MQKEWCVVSNSNLVKILKKKGRDLEPVCPSYHKKDMIFFTDKEEKQPGHLRQDPLKGGHVYSPHEDIHKRETEQFLHRIAGFLNHEILAFDHLILIAPPTVLGYLRKALSSHTLQKIKKEIEKDYTKKPLKEIYKMLTL